ncbi:UvrD-helicase domain-containing protein [Pseudomonas sp. URIL14HWK12:I7]|uniref:UvrD-helicase domain-containing protein n=1 Tax=Pseudomonas sp. URIL14HWK12:I7 TaxID=1283285 RepID=UPI000487CA39|nr:UvrD-helicase domain-containing protein [Pseudomonas sp. URIL14HWK12:I7]
MMATISALVVNQKAISILDRAFVEDAWLQEFEVPQNTDGLRRVESKSIVYLLSEDADLDDGYLVINTAMFGPTAGLAKPRSAFERVIRVALRHFDRSIAIPIQWQPYHTGSRLSVFAQPSRDAQQRVYFDQSPDGSGNLYAFAVTSNPEDLDGVPEDNALYQLAVEGICDALLADPPAAPPVGNFGVLLSEPLGVRLASAGTLLEWYEQRLNREQREFVDRPHDRPVRLRGAAGTGKTQSMVVKCLRDLYADADGDKTFAFLTHSSALAHTVVRGMLHALDPTERWTSMKTPNGQPRLWIGTIYELAQEKLGYEKKGLRPLSLDGRDGREYQRMLIEKAIDQISRDPRIVLDMFPGCPDFQERLKNRGEDPTLIDELMNEFACVLDLEAIKKDTHEANRYARGSRELWQMVLPSEAHRRVVLEIHDVYRSLLRVENMLSMDQMIADFDGYVGTHEWGALRERDGFDLVFVDEYHYFTRAEAMLLHNLFKTRAQVAGRWPLLMAYDIKQGTNDVAISGGMEKFRNPGVGESVLTELKQVYRSTPQITEFLRDLDACFPAMDLEGEYATYVAESQQDDGETPTLTVYDTDINLVDSIFDQATRLGRDIDGGGSQVAVLCLNEALFDKIRVAGRVRDKFVPITTREDLKELRYAKNKCVFSMPEFVAGLQFNTVFLIHADSADYDEDQGHGTRRRYVSRVYLGASRAARKILLSSSKEHGGPSQLLAAPLANGTLQRVN